MPLAILFDRVSEGVCLVRGAENGSAPGQNSAHVVGRERLGEVGLDEPLVAVLDADELVLELERAPLHHGANQRIEAGAVAPTSQHTESHAIRSKKQAEASGR